MGIQHFLGRVARAGLVGLALLGSGCQGYYEIILERREEDEDRSCEAICYDAVTSADTDERGSTYRLGYCTDLDDGSDRVRCTFGFYE